MTDTNSATTIPADAPSGASAASGTRQAPARPMGFLVDARALIGAHGVAVVSIVAVAAVVAGQLAEIMDASSVLALPPESSGPRATVVAVVIYMLLIVEVIRREARDALAHLRPVVQIEDERFNAYAQRMAGQDMRLELLLLTVSALTVTLLFPVLNVQLPTSNQPATFLPASVPAALVVIVGYVVFGWAGLRLVSRTIRLARALGQLTRESVAINVFDTTDVLPFGRIALAGSLAPVGLIVILLLGLGRPESPLGLAVLALAASTSVLALVLPLRGIHGQMRRAKDHALMGLNQQLTDIHADVRVPTRLDGAATSQLNDRISLLTSLRRVVGEMPTWPFRDTVAFGRAVLIASAPLIYTALNGIVDAFVVRRIAP